MYRHPCLLDLSLESIQSFTLSMMLAVDFFVDVLYETEEVPFYSWFCDSCYQIGYLVKCFFSIYQNKHRVFLFQVVNVVNYVDLFNVKTN